MHARMQAEDLATAPLRSFFAAMNEWEWEMNRHFRSLGPGNMDEESLSRDQQAQRGKLEKIFERFCEVGSRASRFKDAGMSFGEPPRYDPELEVILSEERRGGKVVIKTKQEYRFRFRYKHELLERDGAWLIRDNRMRSPDGGKSWRKDML